MTALILRWWSRQPLRPLLTEWRRWCVVPLLLLLNWVAIAEALRSRLAFRISRPALDRMAQAILVDGKERPKQWLGIIPIFRATRIKGGVQFDYDRKEFPWGQRGLYFSADGTAIENSYYRFQERLEGSWYIWHYSGW
jgi:hypothetical protein